MQYKISGASFSYGANTVLKNIDFEVCDKQKVAIVGRNGCGKTTLLKLILGELTPDRNDGKNAVIIRAGVNRIDTLRQNAFADDNVTLLDEVRKVYADLINMKDRIDRLTTELEEKQDESMIAEFSALQERFESLGGYYFEKEYETVIKKFGFTDADKHKKLNEFSGGQRTKIAFIKLLLSKPDILLLDEPTNHLDIESVRWLEDYIKNYPKAVVAVSHDRMFLDRTVDTVYEIENGTTHRYTGNYTAFTKQKKEQRAQQQKEYDARIKEIARLENLAERFRYKATKAAMVQSKLKEIERLRPEAEPEKSNLKTFSANLTEVDASYKDVLHTKNLAIGYDHVLSVINFDLKRGEKVGIIGGNGLGKSTFLKTVTGALKPLSGTYSIGSNVTVGYFDQQSAQISSDKTVLDYFWNEFPDDTETAVRSALGAFLFSGDDVFKRISDLSGGEKVRLRLCIIFRRKPNFLILDEPTNHMDIIGKETLEDILEQYTGTLLFVSHDRYFIKKAADALLVFENGKTSFYPYGYEQYEQSRSEETEIEIPQATKKEKKSYTTPAKEEAKRQRRLEKINLQIAQSEQKYAELEAQLSLPENQTDYVKLEEIQNAMQQEEQSQILLIEEWEKLAESAQK